MPSGLVRVYHLALRITETTVEFQYFRSVLGEHDTGVKDTNIWETLLSHPVYGRLQNCPLYGGQKVVRNLEIKP